MENSIQNPFLLQDQTINPASIELPEELRNNVVTIQCESEKGSCNVYLIGTCHVSSKSKKDVEAIISFLKPEVVFLELCETRAFFLNLPEQLPELPRFTDVLVDLWKSRNDFTGFEVLLSLVFHKVGKKLGVVPGSEFRSAYREANKYGGKLILGDRPIGITCERTWSKMSFWHKTKFAFSCLSALASSSSLALDMDSLYSDPNIANYAQMLEKIYPSIAETLIYERDLFMASRLFEVANDCKSVVAVVGRLHVAGIQKNWKKPISIEPLMEVKATKSSSSVKLWLAVALAAVGIVFFFLNG